MHACMYVCMCACMRACMHACMYVCMYVCHTIAIYGIWDTNDPKMVHVEAPAGI